MSILIKGVEMPTGCGALTLNVWSDGQVEIFDTDGEWKTSEAVPVPPHGDLIDRDALVKAGEDIHETDGYESVWGFSYDMIRNAPTIIEAEEGEA